MGGHFLAEASRRRRQYLINKTRHLAVFLCSYWFELFPQEQVVDVDNKQIQNTRHLAVFFCT
jgi:hypothetical protein